MKKILLTIALIPIAMGTSLFNYCSAQSGGIEFDSLSSGMTSPGAYVLALTMKDSSSTSTLYVGGHFTIAGRDNDFNIAQWVDSISYRSTSGKWEALDAGLDNDVCALQMFTNYLYAGGKFDTAGGIASSHIARWDTAALKWDSLRGKLNGNVYALCVYDNNLYVGGDFTMADGDMVNRIAVWNDSAWAAVGSGFDTGAVYALTVSNDTLYAGGSFLKSNGVVVNHIAKLSGSTWDSVGSGTNNTVYALAMYDNALYAGGAFTRAGDSAARYIASFDSYYNMQWSSLGLGVNDTVRALNAGTTIQGSINKPKAGQGLGGGNALYVGGNFDSAGGYYSPHIAAWCYNSWQGIGTLNGPVFALSNPYCPNIIGEDNGNYIGGRFSGSQKGVYVDTLNNIAYAYLILGGGVQDLANNSNITVYPNPSNGQFTLVIANEAKQSSNTIEVYNVLGEKVYNATLQPQTPKGALNEINLSNQPNGVYLYRVITANGELVGEGKIVVQK